MSSSSEPSWTWISHPELLWVPGRNVNGDTYQIQDGKSSLYQASEVSGAVECIDDNNNDDLALVLSTFSDRDVLHHIRSRYERNCVHTWLGPVLISVNPRRPMPIYTSGFIDNIRRHQDKRNDPHPFAVAARALDNLLQQKRSQWIFAVGLPTSGRQHFNRVVTQYLAQYNGSPNSDPACERIGVKTLKAIEILRSFTEISIDNYRASHISMYLWFDDAGKLMQTTFDFCWMVFKRASVSVNRSFDILSFLENGSDAVLRKELGLPCDSLSASAVSGFETVLLYFSDLGISTKESSALLQLLATILKLRSWPFQLKADDSIQSILSVIDLDAIKTLTVDGITISEKRFNDLVENLYAIAFNWVLLKLNQCMESMSVVASNCNYIAIPDVLGFQSDDLLIQVFSAFSKVHVQQLFHQHIIRSNLEKMQKNEITINSQAFTDDDSISAEKAMLGLMRLAEGEEFACETVTQESLFQTFSEDLDDIRKWNQIPELVFDFKSSEFLQSVFHLPCEQIYSNDKKGLRFYTQLVKTANDARAKKMLQCDLHFVSCISPNLEPERSELSSRYVAEQLSQFVFPAAKFLTSTFVKHFDLQVFLKEFKPILPRTSYSLTSFLSNLQLAFHISLDQIVIGRNHEVVFFKPKGLRVLYALRDKRRDISARIIQKRFRQIVSKPRKRRILTSKGFISSPKSIRNASFQNLNQLLTVHEVKQPETNDRPLLNASTTNDERGLGLHVCKDLESLLSYCNDTKSDPAKLCSSQLLLAIRTCAPSKAKLWLQRCRDIGHDIGEVRLEHAERFITSAAFRLVDNICSDGGKIQFRSSPSVHCNRKIHDRFCTDFTPVVEMVKGINQFKKFSLLRKQRNWARPKGLISLAKAPSMLEYQDVSLHKTLIKVASWRLNGTGKESRLKRDALEIFNDLLGFIKARPQVCPEALANEICKKGRNQVLLRDEIYCQILKQSNRPPNRQIETQVWKMLLICLLSFQPMTEDLGRAVFSHICSRLSSPVIIERYHVLDNVEDIAANCFKAFLAMHKSSVKLPPVSIQTIQQINHSVKYSFRVYIFCVDRHLELERNAVLCPKLSNDCKDRFGLNGLRRSTYVDIQMPGFENNISANELINWIIAKSDLVKRIGTASDQLIIAIQDRPDNPIQRSGIDQSMNVSEMLATVSYRCSKQGLSYWMELYPGPPVEDPNWDVSVSRSSFVEDSKLDFSEVD